jgi:hypothetical protein
VLIADGGVAICDIDVLRHQGELFGPVASDTTLWRALDEIGPVQLRRIAAARAKVRARMWRLFGGPPAARAAGTSTPHPTVMALERRPQDGDIEAVISAGPGEYWNGGKRAEVSGCDLGDHACSDAFRQGLRRQV